MAQARVLTAPARDRRETLRLTTEHAGVFRNVTLIVWTAERWAKRTVAATLGGAAATIDQGVRRLGRPRGLAGLRPITRPGRPPVVSASSRQAWSQGVQTDPRPRGYAFTGSAPRRNASLQQRTGVSSRDGHGCHLLPHERFSWQRPQHPLRGKRDAQAHAKAQDALRALNTTPPTGDGRGLDRPRRHREPLAAALDSDVGAGWHAA
jgi:hypothetical protein